MVSRIWSVALATLLLFGCIEDSGDPAPEGGDDAAVAVDARPEADAAPPARDAGRLPDAEVVGPDAEAPPPPACGNEDDLAPNQAPEDAEGIEPGFARDDLFLCPETADFYRVPLRGGQGLTVRLLADPADVDLDLALLDEAGAVLADSVNDGGQEQLDFVAPADGDYLIRVTGYRDEAAFYALTVTSGCALDAQCPEGQLCNRFEGQCEAVRGSVCGADAFEENDRDDQAAALPAEGVVDGVICGADRDWYALEVEDGATLELLVAFDEGEDIDVFVLEAATGAEVASARGGAEANPERVRLSSLPGGRYLIGLVLYVGEGRDHEASYHLEVAGRSGGCEADRDCANDLYPICDAGICRGVEGGGVAPGGRCGQDADCAAGSELCYTGGPGGHDNFCTLRCDGDAACASLGDGAHCVPVSRRTAVCFPACVDDADCSAFRTCQAGVCELRGECESDRDCAAGEACQIVPQFGRFCGLPARVDCGADPAYDPNDIQGDATPLAADGNPVEGLMICDADTDWFRVTVPPEAAAFTLSVGVEFRAGVDIDVYLFGPGGRAYGEASSPDQTEEYVELRFAEPGDYLVQVDQFSSDALADTSYRIVAELVDNQDRCTIEGGECARTEPLRAICDAASGACRDLPGAGAVPLGGQCDSQDDCGPDAEVCWVFEGGAQGYNICTVTCGDDADCAGIAGSVCTPFQGGQFAVCLPPR
ncbi:MAG: PPC domain-containing protein [bacterium]